MKIETIILAGGKSSRMGKDKALLSIEGKSFLSHIYQQANQFSQQVYIVTPWQEKYQDLVDDNCQFITEAKKFQGPLSAFSQGLTHIQTQWVLLLACDLPYFNLAPIENWINELEQLPPDSVAFLVNNQNRWECLCGFYRRNCLSSIEQYLNTGGKSFQSWLKNVKVTPISIDNQTILFNCNTPEDYLNLNN